MFEVWRAGGLRLTMVAYAQPVVWQALLDGNSGQRSEE